MTTAEMLLRLGAGVGLGTAIGFERQYRARMAGLRTNALVAAGATLFVLLSSYGFGGLSGIVLLKSMRRMLARPSADLHAKTPKSLLEQPLIHKEGLSKAV